MRISLKPTKKATKEYIKLHLSTNKDWAVKCLEVVYANQTEEEKQGEETRLVLFQGDLTVHSTIEEGRTIKDNGVGFGTFDAAILSSLAEWHEKKGFFSPKQWNVLFKKIPKYWNQFRIASNQSKLEINVRKHLVRVYCRKLGVLEEDKDKMLQLVGSGQGANVEIVTQILKGKVKEIKEAANA